MRRAGAVLVSATCLGVLVTGCTADTSDLPGLTASPTVAVTASPTPSPTGIVESSDPDLGIVFDDVPDLTGDEAAVYNWIATFEKEYWRTLTTNQASGAFSLLASADVRSRLEQLAQSNAADKWAIDGLLHVRIGAIAVLGDTATGTVCHDFTEMTVTEGGHPLTLEEAGSADPRSDVLTLVRVPGEDRWMIQESETVGTC